MRSLLFVPADSERKMTKALSSEADVLILDLEDSVTPANRPAARELTAAFVGDARKAARCPLLYVRINPLDGSDWELDVAAVMPARPDGIIMPKPRSGEDVHRLSIAVGHAESEVGSPAGVTRILPIVTETPISVLQLSTYVGSSVRMIGMSWGAEDLGAVVGSLANRDARGHFTSPYRMVRDLCLITAAAASVEPIDTVFVNFRDRAGLEEETRDARRDGFTGKMAIHPDQVGPINAIFTPTQAEVAHARAVIAAFDGAAGVASLDGQMLDRPHLVLAEKVIARAKAAGV
jgi:citrate lyase subunit beta/citryl-CoA lyase